MTLGELGPIDPLTGKNASRYYKDGSCPKCGAGIYLDVSESDDGIIFLSPPVPHFTCVCRLNVNIPISIPASFPLGWHTGDTGWPMPPVGGGGGGTGDCPTGIWPGDDHKTFCGAGGGGSPNPDQKYYVRRF